MWGQTLIEPKWCLTPFASEQHRNTLAAEVSRRDQEYTATFLLDNITEPHVRTHPAESQKAFGTMNPNALKDFLSSLIDKVTLNPASHECHVNYRISMNLQNEMASPRGFKRYASQLLVPFYA